MEINLCGRSDVQAELRREKMMFEKKDKKMQAVFEDKIGRIDEYTRLERKLEKSAEIDPYIFNHSNRVCDTVRSICFMSVFSPLIRSRPLLSSFTNKKQRQKIVVRMFSRAVGSLVSSTKSAKIC